MTLNTLGTIIVWILGSLAGLGLFFFGGGYLISKFKNGSKEEEAESRDLISSNDQIKEFYKQQNEDLKVINTELRSKIEGLTREVGEIKGQLNAETSQKKEYLAILQNRDPETKKFMELLVKAVEDQQVANKEMVELLGEIHGIVKAEQERDLKVVSTSIITKDGH